MGLLNISEQTAVPLDTIKSDAPPATRHGAWWVQLETLAAEVIGGTTEAGAYKELSRFKSPSGARVKSKELEGKKLPGGGTFAFKPQTWLDANGKRHSSLYGAYTPGAGEVQPAVVDAEDAA